MPTILSPSTLDEALAMMAMPHRVAMGAGIDLLESIEQGIVRLEAAVSLGGVAELSRVQRLDDASLRIGGTTTLETIAADADVRARYPLLASACEAAGPAELRTRATLAGNLCQRPRCTYFRRNVPCFKHGGDSCPAREGENRLLAILEGGPCFVVQRSDVATALVALDASIELASVRGTRVIDAADFFVRPADRLDRETVLADDEILVSVRLPSASAGGVQRFAKIADDGWGFALASVAATRRTDGEARLVVGGVSPRPYRVYNSIEEEAISGGLDEDTIEGLAERALLDAEPLSGNAYKVSLAAQLLRDAIRELAAEQS